MIANAVHLATELQAQIKRVSALVGALKAAHGEDINGVARVDNSKRIEALSRTLEAAALALARADALAIARALRDLKAITE